MFLELIMRELRTPEHQEEQNSPTIGNYNELCLGKTPHIFAFHREGGYQRLSKHPETFQKIIAFTAVVSFHVGVKVSMGLNTSLLFFSLTTCTTSFTPTCICIMNNLNHTIKCRKAFLHYNIVEHNSKGKIKKAQIISTLHNSVI
ncbi:hypothetical protein AMTRI_Chr09g33300 [Amborella trichopoda]